MFSSNETIFSKKNILETNCVSPFSTESLTTQGQRGAVRPDGTWICLFLVSGATWGFCLLFCSFFLSMSNLCCRLMLLLFVNSGLWVVSKGQNWFYQKGARPFLLAFLSPIPCMFILTLNSTYPCKCESRINVGTTTLSAAPEVLTPEVSKLLLTANSADMHEQQTTAASKACLVSTLICSIFLGISPMGWIWRLLFIFATWLYWNGENSKSCNRNRNEKTNEFHTQTLFGLVCATLSLRVRGSFGSPCGSCGSGCPCEQNIWLELAGFQLSLFKPYFKYSPSSPR